MRVIRDDSAALGFRIEASEHLDSAQSMFFQRELESIRPQIMEVEYPALKGRSLVYVNESAGPAAEQITTRWMDSYMQIQPHSDYNTEFPKVNFLTQEGSIFVRPFVTGYGWSLQEIRAAASVGRPLDSKLAMLAREACERHIDEVIFNGWTVLGQTMQGLLTVSSPTTYTVPNGAAGTKTWETKTPDEIIADMNGIVFQIVQDTNEVEKPDTLLLPLSSFNLISTTRMGDGSDQTILKFFQATNPHIRRVESTYKAETAGAGSTKRMTAYSSDPTRVDFQLPVAFESLAPQVKGFMTEVPCHARMAGLDVMRPKAFAYGDGI